MDIILFLERHENSWPYRKPVDTKKITDYLDIIKKPMDIETIKKKVEATQ